MRTIAVLVALCFTGTAWAGSGKPLQALLRDSRGNSVGSATFSEEKVGVRVAVSVSGLPPGSHGMHIHEKGACTAPDFVSAGSHFNPYGKKHGAANPEGKHAGDLPNLEVRENGKGEASFLAEGARLGKGKGSLTSASGSSLVIHEKPDDGKTDPAGGAGGRIACGVISPQR